jgi:hypothetical protein
MTKVTLSGSEEFFSGKYADPKNMYILCIRMHLLSKIFLFSPT